MRSFVKIQDSSRCLFSVCLGVLSRDPRVGCRPSGGLEQGMKQVSRMAAWRILKARVQEFRASCRI